MGGTVTKVEGGKVHIRWDHCTSCLNDGKSYYTYPRSGNIRRVGLLLPLIPSPFPFATVRLLSRAQRQRLPRPASASHTGLQRTFHRLQPVPLQKGHARHCHESGGGQSSYSLGSLYQLLERRQVVLHVPTFWQYPAGGPLDAQQCLRWSQTYSIRRCRYC